MAHQLTIPTLLPPVKDAAMTKADAIGILEAEYDAASLELGFFIDTGNEGGVAWLEELLEALKMGIEALKEES